LDPAVLRQFIGTPDMGWKVAWSDRMVSMYTTIPLSALLYAAPHRGKRLRPLPLWGFALLALPLVIDGGTHMISDLAGIGQGFRYTNDWLAALTGNVFPQTFYAGDALGSFNSWMRLITGVLFGLGTASPTSTLALVNAIAASQIERRWWGPLQKRAASYEHERFFPGMVWAMAGTKH